MSDGLLKGVEVCLYYRGGRGKHRFMIYVIPPYHWPQHERKSITDQYGYLKYEVGQWREAVEKFIAYSVVLGFDWVDSANKQRNMSRNAKKYILKWLKETGQESILSV